MATGVGPEDGGSALEGWCVIGTLMVLLVALFLLAHVNGMDSVMNLPD